MSANRRRKAHGKCLLQLEAKLRNAPVSEYKTHLKQYVCQRLSAAINSELNLFKLKALNPATGHKISLERANTFLELFKLPVEKHLQIAFSRRIF